ncbi:MAG: DSD1 family PLP-dependent enzyme [Bryobacteraceae bacterium]|nr:DSD1 family PLP-dependent enzyme [Bryobacteraceae bacterium]
MAGLGAPAVLKSAAAPRGYSWGEVEKMIARGNADGRLTVDDLPTPALLLDLDAFESNVEKMVRHAAGSKRALRPHAKTHKCAQIAKSLMRAGAVGACVVKISEAEAFARGGVTGLLLTSAMVGRHRIERAVALGRKQPDTIFVVDNAQNAQDMNDAARAAGIKFHVAIDLLVANRTGIQTGEPALELARAIDKLPNLKLKGIQAYAGGSSHVVGFEERKKHSHGTMTPAVETRWLIEKNGIECGWLSGGSTGTYNIDSEIDGITELQPGSFIFMDIDYNVIGGKDGPEYRDFRNALTVLATVISKPSREAAAVDAGFKAFATDRKFGPSAKDVPGLRYNWGGDEHGRLDLTQASRDLKLGERLEFIVPHCDPTVNLYDRMFGVRAGKVESILPIDARGMSQ